MDSDVKRGARAGLGVLLLVVLLGLFGVGVMWTLVMVGLAYNTGTWTLLVPPLLFLAALLVAFSWLILRRKRA